MQREDVYEEGREREKEDYTLWTFCQWHTQKKHKKGKRKGERVKRNRPDVALTVLQWGEKEIREEGRNKGEKKAMSVRG